MNNKVYKNILSSFLMGEYNLAEVTLKLALLSENYIPNENHDFDFIMLEEISGTGYISGGQELANVIIENDSELVADHVQWSNADFAAKFAFLYIAPDIPVAVFDFGENRVPDGSDIFRVLWGPDAGVNSGVVLYLRHK